MLQERPEALQETDSVTDSVITIHSKGLKFCHRIRQKRGHCHSL